MTWFCVDVEANGEAMSELADWLKETSSDRAVLAIADMGLKIPKK